MPRRKYPRRKYIDELGISYFDTPQGWCENNNDIRLAKWQQQREELGFDERETWDLAYSFCLWLYERLRLFNEINIIDTTFHEFEYKGETLTLQDCIDRMLEGLKIELTTDYHERTKEEWEKAEDAVKLFALCYRYLWW